MSKITTVSQTVNPPAPAAGRVTFFSKNKLVFTVDEDNLVTQIGGGGITRIAVADITDPSSELNGLSGIAEGDFIVAFQAIAGGDDVSTIYAWDTSTTGLEDVPFTVDGAAGRWLAFSGRFLNHIIVSSADENKIKSFYTTFASLPDNVEFHGMFAHTHANADQDHLGDAVFGHSTGWVTLKSYLQDFQTALTPAASVEINFGRVVTASVSEARFKTLAMDQNTTLTFANPILGETRVLEVSGNFTLTFPGSATVYGIHTKNLKHLVLIRCVDKAAPKYDVHICPEGTPVPPPLSKRAAVTGLLTGGDIEINGGDNTKFDISDGTGQIIDAYTDPDNPVETPVSWSGLTAITPTNLVADVSTFLGIDSGGSVVEQSTQFTPTQERDLIPLGLILHPASVITVAIDRPRLAYGSDHDARDAIDSVGPFKINGNVPSANGSNLKVNKSLGSSYGLGTNFSNSNKVPSVTSDAAMVQANMVYRYQDGSGGFTETSLSTDIDPANFDDGDGGLAAVGATQHTLQPIWLFTANQSRLVLQYGQVLYETQDAALSQVLAGTVIQEALNTEAVLIGWLIVRGNATNLSTAAEARFVNANKRRQASAYVLLAASGDEVEDDVFRVVDDGDNTKKLAFQVAGVTTATTRTVTMPDSDLTLLVPAGLASGQTIVGGTAANEDLILESTANATKGSVILATGTNLDASDENIINAKTITFDAVGVDTSTSNVLTIDFSENQKRNHLLDENITSVVFIAPAGPGNFMIRIEQAGGLFSLPAAVGGWPAAAEFVGDVAPVAPGTANQAILLAVFYDGTTFYLQTSGVFNN